jgi:hypothetical protein
VPRRDFPADLSTSPQGAPPYSTQRCSNLDLVFSNLGVAAQFLDKSPPAVLISDLQRFLRCSEVDVNDAGAKCAANGVNLRFGPNGIDDDVAFLRKALNLLGDSLGEPLTLGSAIKFVQMKYLF